MSAVSGASVRFAGSTPKATIEKCSAIKLEQLKMRERTVGHHPDDVRLRASRPQVGASGNAERRDDERRHDWPL